MDNISYHKRMAKLYKKSHPELCLMQAQHEYAVSKGFKSWKDLRDNFINVEVEK